MNEPINIVTYITIYTL